MNAKFKKVAELKPGDIFAMKNSDISFQKAKVISAESKDILETEVKYEFKTYGKKYQRQDLLQKNSYVLMIG